MVPNGEHGIKIYPIRFSMSPNARLFSFASIKDTGFAAAFPMIIFVGSIFCKRERIGFFVRTGKDNGLLRWAVSRIQQQRLS